MNKICKTTTFSEMKKVEKNMSVTVIFLTLNSNWAFKRRTIDQISIKCVKIERIEKIEKVKI